MQSSCGATGRTTMTKGMSETMLPITARFSMAVIDEEIADVDASGDIRGSHSEDGARSDRVYSPFCVLWW
ncbi:hypothetical protein Sjap_022159 [Stephania japonica]|uniref:Uncharacterized protein n=1 Tax=Stephania japonica TaxID=461633 RepID=A0AAP0ETQ1_9MAGN